MACCGVSPLTERVAKSRWKMLGHILRSDCNSPPQLALSFAVESMNSMRGRLGRQYLGFQQISRKSKMKIWIPGDQSDETSSVRIETSNL